MPVVHIHQTPKNAEQKRALIRQVTDAFGTALGYPAETVQVWIQESDTESFGAGGVPAADAKK